MTIFSWPSSASPGRVLYTTAGGHILLPLFSISRSGVIHYSRWPYSLGPLQHLQVGCYTLQQVAIFSWPSSASPGRVLHITAGGHILLALFSISRSGVTHYSRWPYSLGPLQHLQVGCYTLQQVARSSCLCDFSISAVSNTSLARADLPPPTL